jgi:diguanylate cyclase (GGDEF)-like protein
VAIVLIPAETSPEMWGPSVIASLGIAIPYFAIAYFIARGLMKSGQLGSNPLGFGTALIFFSCGAGHLLHAEHMLSGGASFRATADLHMTLWDVSTAVIALWYLSMRRRYGQLLRSPAMFEDHTRVAAEAAARHDAEHDHLTGLLNRQGFMSAVKTALDPDGNGGTQGLLFVDLDGFKAVNDRFGHLAGDGLLIAAAERLRRATRPNDVLARLGGDEFVILLGGPSTEEVAVAIASRYTELLSAPFEIAGELVTLSSSIGIALAPTGGISASDLLHRADLAMYDAKNDGLGRHSFGLPRPALA